MRGWFDSHAHLWSLTSEPDDALERARAAGVQAVVCVGTDATSSRSSVAVADRHDDVWATSISYPAARIDGWKRSWRSRRCPRSSRSVRPASTSTTSTPRPRPKRSPFDTTSPSPRTSTGR